MGDRGDKSDHQQSRKIMEGNKSNVFKPRQKHVGIKSKQQSKLTIGDQGVDMPKPRNKIELFTVENKKDYNART